MVLYDVAIIGGGAAGINCAIYSCRKNLSVVLFEERALGGSINEGTLVEDWLGIPQIRGDELAKNFEEHLRKYPAEIVFDRIERIEKKEGVFVVFSSLHGSFEARSVVIASGARHKKLGAVGEKDFVGRGLSYCATCDGPLFRDKVVGVVGGGNSAFSNAFYLSDICRHVYLIHRREGFRADEELQKKVFERVKAGRVSLLLNKVVLELKGNQLLSSIVLEDVVSGEKTELSLSGLFVYIGSMPLAELARGLGAEVDERGFIKTDEEMRTSVEGVFAAGDVRGKGMRLITAAADGARAALSAYDFLKQVKSVV